MALDANSISLRARKDAENSTPAGARGAQELPAWDYVQQIERHLDQFSALKIPVLA